MGWVMHICLSIRSEDEKPVPCFVMPLLLSHNSVSELAKPRNMLKLVASWCPAWSTAVSSKVAGKVAREQGGEGAQ